MSSQRDKKQLNIKVDPGLYAALKILAARTDEKLNVVVTRIVREGLKQEDARTGFVHQ